MVLISSDRALTISGLASVLSARSMDFFLRSRAALMYARWIVVSSMLRFSSASAMLFPFVYSVIGVMYFC